MLLELLSRGVERPLVPADRFDFHKLDSMSCQEMFRLGLKCVECQRFAINIGL
jgi:hypothetical protein